MEKQVSTPDKIREGFRLLGEGFAEALEQRGVAEEPPTVAEAEEKAAPRMMIAPGTKCPECGSKLATGEGLVRCSLVSCKLHGAVAQIEGTSITESLLTGHGLPPIWEEPPTEEQPEEQPTEAKPQDLKAICKDAILRAARVDRKETIKILAKFGAKNLAELKPGDYADVTKVLDGVCDKFGEGA